ncbi:MAG: C-GCAxxG-C-C family protein [Lachnospiraceae bacterium]|nr:C-GCAxxG-C-C family protein [Lachnospiraceae bacterium]MDY3222741.1 C-GCAxxG-C-C family protein [Lachnospiraceae bacterium]
MNKKEEAIELHNKKYNCAQAVSCAFAKETGIEERILFQANEGFGLGMGGTQGVCGALAGAVMLAGFKNSDGDMDNPASKASTYQLSRQMLEAFKEKTGSTICKELKGIETGQVLCSCSDCVRAGVEVVEEILGL